LCVHVSLCVCVCKYANVFQAWSAHHDPGPSEHSRSEEDKAAYCFRTGR